MKILFLSTILPSAPQDPGSPRSFCFARELSKRHEVYLVLCPSKPPEEERVEALRGHSVFKHIEILPEPPPTSWKGKWRHRFTNSASENFERRSPVFVRTQKQKVRDYIKSHAIDVVLVDGLSAAQFCPDEVPQVADLCDSLSLLNLRHSFKLSSLPAKASRFAESLAYRKWEQKIARKFESIIFISNLDREFFLKHSPKARAAVISNGVDFEYFSPSDPIESDKIRLLFLGVLSYPPNTDAAIYLAQKIFPRIRAKIPDVELVIVGKSPPPEVTELGKLFGVSVFPDVPDIRPFFAHSNMFLCPLRFGAGMKNKVLQAMATGLPVVASGVAVEGLAVQVDQEFFLGEDAKTFAERVLELLNNPERAQQIRKNALEYVSTHHSWEKSGAKIERELLDALEKHPAAKG